MKKLILLLLFIPLVSFGQNEDVKKNRKETDLSLNGVVITGLKQKIKKIKEKKLMILIYQKMNYKSLIILF